jgi:hypothetical protein
MRDDGRLREPVPVRIAALRADPALVRSRGRPVRKRRLRTLPSLALVDAEVREREQPRARREDELGEVRGPLATKRRHRLADLQRVADGVAERLVHVGEQADDVAAGAPAEIQHRLRQSPRALDRLHECAVADLDVEHDRVGAGGDLLRHDARRDQLDAVDRRSDVAQRVQLLVGRDEIGRRADDRQSDVAHLSDEFAEAELDAEAGNRFQLVERATGVTEPAAAHLAEGNAARRDDGTDGDRRLVADAAGRVLVDDAAAELLRHVDRLAAPDERVGHRERLGAGQAAEHDGHAERRHLVVRHIAARIAEDELAQLVVREFAAVSLALDELRRVDRHGVTIGCPGIPRRGALPPSHAFTVAPTSPNSPSCRAPFAYRPSTYASSSACSREWSVDGVVGSQP